MKILLISPPYPKDNIFRKSMKNLGAVLPPLGIAYIAAMLEREGHKVKIIDGPAWATVFEYSFDDLEKDIKEFNPDVAGVSASNSQIEHAKKAISLAKSINNDCVVILGGTLISADPKALLSFEDVDFGVYGEADLTFPEIIKAIETKEPVEGKEGVIWRENGEVKFLKPKSIINLDQVPMPARHLLKMEIYRPSPANYRKLPATTIMTSRGCPYQCIFCSRPTEGTAFRAHSAERVVEEIEHLVNEYGIRDIQIFDDTFSLIPSRVEKICKLMIEKKIDVWWNCMTRVDKINPELLALMKKAGCYEIGFGIESGSDRILQFIKKATTTDLVRKGVKMTKDAGIDVRGFFMIGFPTETRDEIMQTIEFAKELDVDVAQFMVSTPFPGTEMWEIAKANGTISDDWSSFTFYAPDKVPFSSDLLSEKEIIALYRRAYTSFYLRPKFMLKQLIKIRSFGDIYRNWLAAKGVLGW
ncbi:MAG: radical SAM protein [Nanoarchaeota archaeon]|nr:radical SAM protein [Nanoarchaeota archaeon]